MPSDLESIPLEYFYHSIQLLKKLTNNDEKLTLIGYSRGAELALLLASEYDEFCAVIAGAPGAYITSGLKNSIYAPIPSWTLNDEAKPYLKFQHRPRNMFPLLKQWILRRPASFFGIWDDSLKKLDKLEDTRIKVEQIQAPVLLVSGDRDQIWPASNFANVIQAKLNDVEHLRYEKGGHFIAFPYALPHLPSNIYEHVGGGMIMDSGGTKEANASAAKHSWPLISGFIEKHSLS
ncbi:acyl-CoA thioester hydrolase/BAAT C-terminal domain-containing protein [Bacillus sp. JCM 19041]|uniref:acyl-CoA thioester hydrolase/BAAT C-terminal domain-containing protein n=1 Tax=Bacillus sp. JCM 19041 TaxID=1460637 RepID=UPI0006D25043